MARNRDDRCMEYLQRSMLDEDGEVMRTGLGYILTCPVPCNYPVYQTLFRCAWCLSLTFSDVRCDQCIREEIEIERRCDLHKLSRREIALARGEKVAPPTQRELLATALGVDA